MIWLDNELLLFKQNIEILRVNQRIGRLAFLWAVLGLMCSKFLAYFLIVVLEEFVHDVSFQGSTYLSYIYFGSLQIIHIVVYDLGSHSIPKFVGILGDEFQLGIYIRNLYKCKLLLGRIFLAVFYLGLLCVAS